MIDARGLGCPQPLLMLHAAMETRESAYQILVDTPVAKENTLRYAEYCGYEAEILQSGAEYTLTFRKMTAGENLEIPKLVDCSVGCGAKVSAEILDELLEGLPAGTDPKLLGGYGKNDDACVFALNETEAMLQTTDFFPPIVKDPYLYGQIAAANALSDIYAMGGEPRLALNILTFPREANPRVVKEILRGGYDKVLEAGAVIAGGHTVHAEDYLYGLSVTGFVSQNRLWTNGGAKPGDVLLLTKCLGTGIMTTAAFVAPYEEIAPAYQQMAQLNRAARDILVAYPVHACTDITGFGFLGHALEMARASDCTLHIQTESLPVFDAARKYAPMGFIPKGAYRNRAYVSEFVSAGSCSRWMMDVLCDPQTSGGLLVSVEKSALHSLMEKFEKRNMRCDIVGYVEEKKEQYIVL